MTTVVASRSQLTMVADSRVSHGYSKFRSRKKISKLGRFLAGVAGDYAPALAYLSEFEAAVKGKRSGAAPTMPAHTGEFELMVLSREGLWIYGEDGTPIEVEEDIYVIGTGGTYAHASLLTQERLGQPHDLRMAVEVACDIDGDSGLPLVELTLAQRR